MNRRDDIEITRVIRRRRVSWAWALVLLLLLAVLLLTACQVPLRN